MVSRLHSPMPQRELRRRSALGLIFVLAALGFSAQSASGQRESGGQPTAQDGPVDAPEAPTALQNDLQYRRWRVAMTWGLVILITFLTAAAAIVVFSRRFQRWIVRERKRPTPDGDVWAMHKIPDEMDDMPDQN